MKESETPAVQRSMGDAHDISPSVLERARIGDAAAFATLVRHYDEGLRALAYRLLGDPQRMDDALQETYLKAFRALPRFRGDSALRTWLYRIAYRACLDELGRASHELPLDHGPQLVAPSPDLPEALTAKRRLEEALGALAPRDRATVLLVDAQGFDYESAGKVLGIPAGTVASRLSRARAVLRRVLGTPAEERACS